VQAYAQGKVTVKKDEIFSGGRLSEYTVGDEGEVVLGSAVIVTPENVGKFKF
jgi:rhamnose transport system substrate-binding protein